MTVNSSSTKGAVVSVGCGDDTDVWVGGVGGGRVSAGAERKTLVVEKGNEQVRGNEVLKHIVGDNQLAA